MSNEHPTRRASLIACVVLSITVVGYFTGLQSPVKPSHETTTSGKIDSVPQPIESTSHETVLPATHYSDMPDATYARAKAWMTSLEALKSNIDPLAEITVQPTDKEAALRARAKNRAFNGAPPTIPHPIDQRSDRACVACHRDGVRTTSLRVPRMSHQFLANCTQCHVEDTPRHMAATEFRENNFAGLPAPSGGPRAFSAAPPVIPHSTWMRSDCLSCHGVVGHHGIRTTHPWRQNCQQCHGASSKLNQTLLGSEPQFLPALKSE